MVDIETQIIILSNESETLLIRFSVTNLTNEDVWVLKRNTPLEGLRSDCLLVLVDGEKIDYDGYFVKRTPPGPSDYVMVKAGEAIFNDVDISDAYDVSRVGNYEIKFRENELVVLRMIPTNVTLLTEKRNVTNIDSVESSTIRISREHIISIKETIGQRMRDTNIDLQFERKELVRAVLKSPKIIGGTPAQKKTVEKAHKKGYSYVKQAIRKLANDNSYKRWFGPYTDSRGKQVESVYKKMKNRMESVEFSYHINGSDCAESDYAYTTIGGRVIWLCVCFWQSPDAGFESRAGTVVHEHSHASGKTDDFEYSSEDCIALAKSDPDTAVINADSYEYYAESLTV